MVAPKKVARTKKPVKPKVTVRLEPYVVMDKVQGTVTSEGPGALTLGICTVREWARCKAEKRPPIPSDTVTVQFGKGRDGRFRFDKGDAMIPPFFVFSTPESECRIDPIQVKGKDGPAL